MSKEPVYRYLDHAVLVPSMTQKEAAQAIQVGIDYKTRTVCVRPCDIDMAKKMCQGTETEVCCVLDFPHGCGCTEVKIAEAKLYCEKGVKEIDMVVNYGWVRSGEWDRVENDIKAVVDVAHQYHVAVKVIFETSQLDLEQIAQTTGICIKAGADFVKTSTGFNGEGATEEAVDVMLKTASGRIKVKPSGGIRDRARAELFIEKGVDRLGVGCNATPIICSPQSENV